MLTQITSSPEFISPEEHDQLTSSTPASFTDIPPVLRFEDGEVEVVLIPSTGWSEGKVKGKLWVTEAAVAFVPQSGTGWSLPFPSLTLHALTPSTADGPAHVYCQVDASDEGDIVSGQSGTHTNGQTDGQGANGHEDINGDGEEEEDGGVNEEDEFTPMREIRIFLPEHRLQPLFEALSQCSALHASLLPSGEPSSFFGFGDMQEGPEDEEWEDDDPSGELDGDEGEQGEEGGEGGDGGRALSRDQKRQKRENNGEGEVDQLERLLDLVDWGSVKKPAGWEGAQKGQFDDAEKQ